MDGVSITQPGPPVRNASASSMQCRQPEPAPAKAVGGGYQRHDLVAGVGSAWPIAQGEVLLYQFGKAEMLGRVASRINPALATKRRSSKATWMRSGWLRGSIYWVLLVWGCFSVSKTIIPDAQGHFLTPSARRYTHLFGGLGIRNRPDHR